MVIRLDNGVMYRVLEEGSGSRKPTLRGAYNLLIIIIFFSYFAFYMHRRLRLYPNPNET